MMEKPRRAYPRSRGATCGADTQDNRIEGLSPLARGNRSPALHRRGAGGPIPARAGQPVSRRRLLISPRAYPRSRGATCGADTQDNRIEGLSPLARGNHRSAHRGQPSLGPIPARAGQPFFGRQQRGRFGAYPRSRGATTDAQNRRLWAMGLSPLARGNLDRYEALDRNTGPIPARAGQPASARARNPSRWAYPRSRGATVSSLDKAIQAQGLSPLARGNRMTLLVTEPITGPIPARAGQPFRGCQGALRPAAYPRSRGATSRGQLVITQEKTTKLASEF